MEEFNFCLDKLSYGTHETKWDLSVFLYKGAVLENRRTVGESIKANRYGEILPERIEFVSNLFEHFNYKIISGLSRNTLTGQLEKLWTFIRWCEKQNRILSKDEIPDLFISWVNSEIIVVREKNLDEYSAYKKFFKIANIITSSQNLENFSNSASLMLRTNLSLKPQKKQSEVPNQHEIFEFGKFLKSLIDQLTIDVIRGEQPILITLSNERTIYLKSNLVNVELDIEKLKYSEKKQALEKRRALTEDESLLDSYKRSNPINVRIEAELMIFMSQTNMNLAQARNLNFCEFRLMTKDDEYEVFTVYKGRKQAEASFKFYQEYKNIFLRYLQWLKEVGFNENDKLFPFVAREKLKANDTLRKLHVIRNLCKDNGFKYFPSTQLRKFKANWLFENSDDVGTVTNLMSHSERTFRNNYQKTEKNKALKELSNFNSQNLKRLVIGLCSNNLENPQIMNTVENILTPDCINPEGCLFCTYHKDIESYDYCFKLVSHRYLKLLEMAKNPNNGNHPAKLIVERLNEKIDGLRALSDKAEKWIVKAQNEVQSGEYHPDWNNLILLLDEMA